MSRVSVYASGGGAIHGSSRMPASIALPHKFSSIENGELRVTGMGMPFSSA